MVCIIILYTIYVFIADINECSTRTHNCAQRCTNTAGSYTCSCNSGYRLAANGRSCTANPTTTPPTTPPPTTPPLIVDNGVCGGRLTATSGSFQTPGWPNNYPQQNFECEWIIDIPLTGYAVQFTIDSSAYGINGRAPCVNDNIQFFDGIQSGARSLQKLCRFDNPGRISTSSTEAKVVFTGRINRNRPRSRVGVKVSYTIVDIGMQA